MTTLECSCPKCGIKYVMYIPDSFTKEQIKKLKECACGGKLKTSQKYG